VIIVVDGPEKAGKTTFIANLSANVQLNGRPTRVVKWGKLDDGRWAIDSVYAAGLVEAAAWNGLTVWDRSWASEAVYGRLLNRERRLAADPWLGEWLYGRGVDLKLMLLGDPDPQVMRGDRTPDDLPVDVVDEKRAFSEYGRRFGWQVHPENRTIAGTTRLVREVMVAINRYKWEGVFNPDLACGPNAAPWMGPIDVAVVGEKGSLRESIPGGWLPFSTRLTEKYGRALGDDALRCVWTNAADNQVHVLYRARYVVACGQVAVDWVRQYRTSNDTLLYVPHPAALYRWGRLSDRIEEIERQLVLFVSRTLSTSGATGRPTARFDTIF
jgi:hypothetical protein